MIPWWIIWYVDCDSIFSMHSVDRENFGVKKARRIKL